MDGVVVNNDYDDDILSSYNPLAVLHIAEHYYS